MDQARTFSSALPRRKKAQSLRGGVPPGGRPGKSLVRVAMQNGFAPSAAPFLGLYSGYSFKIATYRFWSGLPPFPYPRLLHVVHLPNLEEDILVGGGTP
jgi:hypothetical protein